MFNCLVLSPQDGNCLQRSCACLLRCLCGVRPAFRERLVHLSGHTQPAHFSKQHEIISLPGIPLSPLCLLVSFLSPRRLVPPIIPPLLPVSPCSLFLPVSCLSLSRIFRCLLVAASRRFLHLCSSVCLSLRASFGLLCLLAISLCVSLHVSVSLFHVSVSRCLSLSLSLSMAVSLSVFPSPPVSVSASLCLFLVSLAVASCICLSLDVSVCSLPISVCVCVVLSVSSPRLRTLNPKCYCR